MMKKYFLFLCCTALFSCSTESPEVTRELSMEEKLAKIKLEDIDDVCLTVEPKVSENRTGRVSYKGLSWRAGKPISVKFLNGDTFKQNMVKKYANEWTLYANIKFEWVGSNDYADLKIAFGWNGDGGNWSEIGDNALMIRQDKPSMNLGSLRNDSYEENWSRIVLHEFGHALGLAHELQHPRNSFKWDMPFVYFYYKDVYGWDKDKVDSNIIDILSVKEVDYDVFDSKSVMMYSIPSGLILNYISFWRNNYLSDGDKRGIEALYPY